MDNSIKYHHKLIDEINETISNILEQTDEEKKADIESIRKDILYIRDRLSQKNSSLGFSKIRIRFDGEYNLALPRYGVETFDRNLKGEMYFSVVGGNDDYMDLRTRSMPDTFKIRLHYKTLKEYENQRGYGYLIYQRGREALEGQDTKMVFKIIKKS